MPISDKLSRTAYSAMGNNRHDYEANSTVSAEWGMYGLHCHDFYELYIHFTGAKHYCIDNKVYPVEANHLMVIPPFRMHGLIGDQVLKDYDRCFLYISPNMLRSCGGQHLDLETFITQHTQRGICQFRMTEEEGQRCRRLLSELQATQDSAAPLIRFDNYAKVVQFMSIICQAMSRANEAFEPIVVNEAMQDVLAYINDHYTTPIKLEAIARQFGVSVSFLSHEFVKYTGRSVYDYVLYRRVLLAKELIASDRPLNEVAYHCGFNDYSSFLRSFTRLAGQSPSAYRKGQPVNVDLL